DDRGRVLGTFALYRRSPGRPGARLRRIVALLTHTTAIAITQARRVAEQDRLAHDLGERVKELTVLHQAARLLQSRRSIDQALLADLAALLPPGWQYPDVCAACITYGHMHAATPGWRETPWRQGARFDGGD